MFFLILLNCVAMAYEYPTMNKDDLDGQILFWRCAECPEPCLSKN
jgi:hypothetical protein